MIGQELNLRAKVDLLFHLINLQASKKTDGDSSTSFIEEILQERFSGMTISKLNRAEYDSLSTKGENTIYYVEEIDGSYSQYIGNILITGDHYQSPLGELNVQISHITSESITEGTPDE